jgi:hypothetical protein
MKQSYMCSYLILFNERMINLKDDATQGWLNKLGVDGRIISIDEVDETTSRTVALSGKDNCKGFAVINALDQNELDSILKDCPDLNQANLCVYKLR